MKRSGLTLMELMAVLTILVITAAFVVPIVVGDTSREAHSTVAKTNLATVRDAFIRLRTDNPFGGDNINMPLTPERIRMGDLFERRRSGIESYREWNPLTNTGWRGPYLNNPGTKYAFPTSGRDLWNYRPDHGINGTDGDFCLYDGYVQNDGSLRPLVLEHAQDEAEPSQWIVWVQSAGPNGVLERPLNNIGEPVGIPFPTQDGNGTEFRVNGALIATVDDLVLRVHR